MNKLLIPAVNPSTFVFSTLILNSNIALDNLPKPLFEQSDFVSKGKIFNIYRQSSSINIQSTFNG